ncbi:amidohydrolase [candidate division KSB1 bacterium]
MKLMRQITTASLILIAAGFLFYCGGVEPYDGPSADLVIKNAKTVTIDKENRRAEAVAVSGEFIIGVGSNRYIDQFIEEGKTEIIDAQGRLVVPGFNDAHVHFRGIDPDYIDLRYVTDPKIITDRVREKVAQARPGEMISGGRWEHEMFVDKKWPTKELLDSVAPDNPVALSRADGHSVLVNSYVLNKSGITKDTPDPYGGEIQRDPATGEPTGIIKELARRILDYGAVPVRRTPEEQEQRRIEEWQTLFDMAARVGVTSVHAMGADPEIYEKFRDMGRLTLRVYMGGILDGATDEDFDRYLEMNKRYPREDNWIRMGYLKGHIDGTLGSGTALFFEPFLDEPDKSGLPFQPYEDLERLIVKADALGFQTAIHAIGSRGNHLTLNAYEKAVEVNGVQDNRHRIEHSQILIEQDIPRFAELGVIASMQPTHCITDKRFAEKRLGIERCKGAYVWRSLLDTGAKIAFGTDYGVEPLDPLEGIYASATRKDRMGEEGNGWFPEQKLTVEEAIELYTLGSAYAEFMDDRKGMIKKGYLADMVVYEKDMFSMPEAEIMNNRVDYTIVGGKVVFKREGNN